MKSRLSTLAWLGLLAAPLALTPGRPLRAGVQAIATPVPSEQTAPALVQDSREALRRALLARLEFEELNLQLVGVASFSGEAACTIRHPDSADAMIYRAGDVIGGYRIVSIDQSSVQFERNDLKFFLTAGESSNGGALADADASAGVGEDGDGEDAAQDAGGAAEQGAIAGPLLDHADSTAILKTASDDLKRKTKRFSTSKLIEEVTGDSDSPMGSSGRFALPIKGVFTSGFGYRRHPLGGGVKFHRGIDLAAPEGTPIHAAASGVVTKSGWIPTLGNYVAIDHGNGYSTRYGHMSRRIASVGDHISQGDTVGLVGSTGASTGNHLHFEVRKNDVALDPLNFVKVRRR